MKIKLEFDGTVEDLVKKYNKYLEDEAKKPGRELLKKNLSSPSYAMPIYRTYEDGFKDGFIEGYDTANR